MSETTPLGPSSQKRAAEPGDLPAASDADEDAAVKEALGQLSKGQGRPLSEYAVEFNARFAARYGPA